MATEMCPPDGLYGVLKLKTQKKITHKNSTSLIIPRVYDCTRNHGLIKKLKNDEVQELDTDTKITYIELENFLDKTLSVINDILEEEDVLSKIYYDEFYRTNSIKEIKEI